MGLINGLVKAGIAKKLYRRGAQAEEPGQGQAAARPAAEQERQEALLELVRSPGPDPFAGPALLRAVGCACVMRSGTSRRVRCMT